MGHASVHAWMCLKRRIDFYFYICICVYQHVFIHMCVPTMISHGKQLGVYIEQIHTYSSACVSALGRASAISCFSILAICESSHMGSEGKRDMAAVPFSPWILRSLVHNRTSCGCKDCDRSSFRQEGLRVDRTAPEIKAVHD